MRRLFSFRSSTANTGNGDGASSHDDRNKHKKTLEEDKSNGSSRAPDIRMFRSRSRHGELKNEEANNPQLKRCLSFSSSATNRCLEERSLSFSCDVPCSVSNDSDVPHHAGDVDHYEWSPERHPVIREYRIKVPKAHAVQETESPGSKCYPCSTGHSPVSSPIAPRCRSARLTNLLNKNEVLDLYIDGEQEATRQNQNQKQNSPIRSVVSHLGRPPRPQSIVPSSPKSTKEILKTYLNADIKDACHHQLSQEGTRDTYKISSLCDVSGNHASVDYTFSGKLSHLEDYTSESISAPEDIYEDLQHVHPPNVNGTCTSMCPTSGVTSCCFLADSQSPDGYHGLHKNDLDFAPDWQETDEMLIRRAKEVEVRFMAPSGENYELHMLRDTRLSSTDMFQLLQSLTEDRENLALELSSQIKERLTERFAAKELYKQSKIKLDIRTRRLEKEKMEVQTTLEKELDRRSNDWSLKLVKFQSEEQRLQERVRELAEQNVSLQREATFLEANKMDTLNRTTSLESQNKQLNDELQMVRDEHDNLHNCSIELQARFTMTAEERDHIRGILKEKDDENKGLHKVIAKLQRICNEQEKTITGLRQGCNDELDKKSVECSDNINRMQMELIRLTGVEQNLRREVQSCNLDIESLRRENIALLNRLQSSEKGSNFSSIRLDQELHARVDNLQIQVLSLLDKTSQLCAKLLDLIKCKRHENESVSEIDALTITDYTLKYQSIKGGIESLKRSLGTVEAVLAEKQNVKEKSKETGGGSSSRQQDELSLDDFELKLKEEAMLNRVLKEMLLSKELDVEQLQTDLSSSIRIQDVLQNEIQRVQDELSCLTHKSKHLELQGLKKDECISLIQLDFQESAKELAALRGTLKTVTDERDLLWQEAKQLRKTISSMQNDIALLKKEIESLDEAILVKEGQISILQDSMDKPFDMRCSPMSMKQFDME